MAKFEDLKGQKFGYWTVVERAENHPATRSAQWLCECECGTKKIIRASALKSGKSKSCGCHKNDYNKIHGGKGTRLYECWRHMRYRCDNKNNQAYEMYGARGIKVCDEWQKFEVFRDWALENGYSDNLTLDRIDVNGNYEPSNCRWADVVTQMNNRRSTPHYTVDGRSLTSLYKYHWDRETGNRYTPNMLFWTDSDIDRMRKFFKEWSTEKDDKDWTAVTRFQDMVKQRRLDEKHAKETNPIDAVMETVKEIPEDFKKWVSEKAMSFSRYLIYSARSKNEALAHCTYCNGTTLIDRTKIRLRNNEKGICPLCGSPVTIKARGRMPMHIWDERIVSFIEPREEGFLWRYFTAHREVKPDGKTNDGLFEIVRTFYKFAPNGTPCTSSYEYREYKQTGIVRWCTDEGYRASSYCTLYPGNLPEAWKDTPMKYSALEILAENRPSEQIHYAKAINRYRGFPQLEWFIKMGLYKLAAHLINEFHDGAFGYESRNGIRGLRKSGKTIFEILGLTKENTRILQSIDGNIDELRLLQEAQSSGYNLKVEELERFYKLFGCNTTLIRKENRKSTIHKICRYIEREGADYRVGESGQCWRYSYMQRKERPDIREERLQNCAKDWLDYLNWCKELKYDLNNMFFYFPKNFKKVHDRTAAEYQALQDKKAAEKKRREDERIKREAEVMKKLLEEMLKENAGIDNAFLIKGKGLILRAPRDTQEIKNEGAALHHCVGTYVDRVAKGQTHIFFVRRVEEPDTPYFTMEYNNGRVIQCRGNHNCGMPASVKAFVAAFEKLMKEREEKMERKCG